MPCKRSPSWAIAP